MKNAEKKAEAAVKAKDKALKKAVAAKCAAEKAKNALGVLLVSNGTRETAKDGALNDEEFALQLHLAMNGSQRLSRNLRPRNSSGLLDAKRSRHGKDSESGSNRFGGKVELCTEDNKFFESMKNSRLDSEKREQEVVSETSESNTVAMVKVDEETCSDIVNTDAKLLEQKGVVASPVGDVRVGENSAESLRMERCSSPQRYMKKYSKRNLKGPVVRKEKLPCRQISCSESSRTYSEGQTHTLPVHSSS